jgi:nucleotide-binding universal stress UspA family protein
MRVREPSWIEATSTKALEPAGIFGRVLVGVDGSDESYEAARQAARLTERDGTLDVLSVYSPPPLVGGVGIGIPAYLDEDRQRTAAENIVRRTRIDLEDLHEATGAIMRGCAWDELLHEIENRRTTLVAVGSHGVGRTRGIVFGSTVTELVHKAPCSVLVARPAVSDFPRRIVVGLDGSPESAAAHAEARLLARRFGARLWPIVAYGGKSVDALALKAIVDHHYRELPDGPVRSLAAAGADADLLVVGSRGLHGIRALASVSEQVSHLAPCSVLVVRRPAQNVNHERSER